MRSSRRDEIRDLHRYVANHLVKYCWVNDLDSVVMRRYDLEYFFEIQKIMPARVKMIFEDFKPWFPYISEHSACMKYESCNQYWSTRTILFSKNMKTSRLDWQDDISGSDILELRSEGIKIAEYKYNIIQQYDSHKQKYRSVKDFISAYNCLWKIGDIPLQQE